MFDRNKAARDVCLARGYLDDVHKAFNHATQDSDSENTLTREDRVAWHAVVEALDALAKAEDWSIDNGF